MTNERREELKRILRAASDRPSGAYMLLERADARDILAMLDEAATCKQSLQVKTFPKAPDGWRVVAYRLPKEGDYVLECLGSVTVATGPCDRPMWILRWGGGGDPQPICPRGDSPPGINHRTPGPKPDKLPAAPPPKRENPPTGCPRCGGDTEYSRDVPPEPYYCEACADRLVDEQDADACAFAAQRDALAEELDNMVTQYGCDCGHPACKRCRDTRDAKAALEAARDAAKDDDPSTFTSPATGDPR